MDLCKPTLEIISELFIAHVRDMAGPHERGMPLYLTFVAPSHPSLPITVTVHDNEEDALDLMNAAKTRSRVIRILFDLSAHCVKENFDCGNGLGPTQM